ncbi:MAG: CPBP family intramembrane metalloprotease [Chloroflexota bacterium]|nr:CPBP family intramembrane metalloprotease [Chloroflexota bacterium]
MMPQNLERKRTVRNLMIFSAVVLACGWLGVGLDRWMDNPPGQPGLGSLLWLIAPLLTALLLRAFAGDGWQDFGLRPALQGNAIWYAVSLLMYPLVAVLVLAIGGVLGLVTAPNFSFSLLLSVFTGGLIAAFVKNIFEEFAWRGYLAPKVYSLGLNAYVGHAIVGLGWGCWHIPYLLFLLDRTLIQATTTQSLATFIPLAIANLIAASIVYGEIRLLTDSVWPPLLLHTVGNALVDVLVVQGFVRIVPGTDFLVSPGHQSLLTMGVFALLGIGLHQLRIRKQLIDRR